jgi:hypothetical protein
MARCRLLRVAVLAAASLGLLSAAPALGGGRQLVNFLARCNVSGEGAVDPIVFPGQPGMSHMHTFFGNKGVNAFSTLESLRGQQTSCSRRSDTAAYWVPTLYRDGKVVRPTEAVAYYTVREGSRVQAYPPGLKVVAGDMTARAPQSLHVVWWTCAVPGVVAAAAVPPADCSTNTISARRRSTTRGPRSDLVGIQLHVRFPDCWDGRHLDSADHHRHMAYSRGEVCSRDHPVKVPSLILIVDYPLASGRGVTLASGGRLSGHGDFFNAWNQSALKAIVRDCVAGRPRCGRH